MAEAALADEWVINGDRVALQRRVLRLGKPPRRWKRPCWAAVAMREPLEVVKVGHAQSSIACLVPHESANLWIVSLDSVDQWVVSLDNMTDWMKCFTWQYWPSALHDLSLLCRVTISTSVLFSNINVALYHSSVSQIVPPVCLVRLCR